MEINNLLSIKIQLYLVKQRVFKAKIKIFKIIYSFLFALDG